MADDKTVIDAATNIIKAQQNTDKVITKNLTGEGTGIDETLFGSAHKGQHGALDTIRFCHWAAPEYGPIGENAWNLAFKAAQLAISSTNAAIQGQIADKKQDLAEGYYQQAKYKWDRFAGSYQPLETAILTEAYITPMQGIDCPGARSRAQAAVNSAYGMMDTVMARTAKAYRLCMDDTVVRQMAYSRNQTLVDTENYNLRDSQWFADYKNDQRWNRRSNILNLGRNLGSIAMRYGDVAGRMLDNVGNAANRVAGSISQALGYYGSRFDTRYPTEYLSGTATNLVDINSTGGIMANSATGYGVTV